MTEQVLYEYPLNERIRNFLRVADYLAQLNCFAESKNNYKNNYDNLYSLLNGVEAIKLVKKVDLKSELIKELERITWALNRIASAPTVNTNLLLNTIEKLKAQASTLHNFDTNKFEWIQNNCLISSLQYKTTGTSNCFFDVPWLHFWLNQNDHNRQTLINNITTVLKPIELGINLIIDVLRNSTFFSIETVKQGVLQKNLDYQQNYQLIRISFDSNLNVAPEITPVKHLINIRFMRFEQDFYARPKQAMEDFEIQLACCAL